MLHVHHERHDDPYSNLLQRTKRPLQIFVICILVVLLAVLGSLDPLSLPITFAQSTSWNPNVSCSADLVTIQNILGSAYPSQSLAGSPYQTSSTSGGVPNKRALSPPCTITNIHGQTVSSFVQVSGVTLHNYFYETRDCATQYDPANGGGPFPNGETLCDSTGNVFAVGTSSGYVHVEIDRDWMAKGYAGPSTTYDNNNTIAQVKPPCTISLPCTSTVSIDVQGFVYWDPEGHWELHPLTAWRLSSTSTSVSTSFTWLPASPSVGQQISFNASASGGTPPYTYSWSFGDNTTFSSANSTATHTYSAAGKYTVSLVVGDSKGLSGSSTNQLTVTSPTVSVNFNWSPKSHNLGFPINFTASVSGGASPYTYAWNFGDGSPIITGLPAVTHTYPVAGTYNVSLAATDTNGVSGSQTKQVRVRA
jgi:PKD repeat protein